MRSSSVKSAFCLKVAMTLLLWPQNSRSAEPAEVFVLDKFLAESAGLGKAEIDAVHHGKAAAVVLDSPDANEVFIAGIVHIDAEPERYLQLANDFETLRKLPGYLAVQRFSNPPKPSDLSQFTVETDDVKDLKVCKVGDCDVQLPADQMEQFQKSVNWSAPDAANQVNRLAQQMTLEALLAYQKGGNPALGMYRDKEHPTKISETFQSLLSRLKVLPVYLPELNRILLEYPNVDLKTGSSDFYWEKVNFGLKPTIRMVHQITYRGGTVAQPVYSVALKQLYASHYFRAALDLTVCVRDSSRPNERGFHLMTVKASQQEGLTGLKGSVVRKVAVGKSRSSLERTLTAIKQKLEAGPR